MADGRTSSGPRLAARIAMNGELVPFAYVTLDVSGSAVYEQTRADVHPRILLAMWSDGVRSPSGEGVVMPANGRAFLGALLDGGNPSLHFQIAPLQHESGIDR